MNLEDKKLKQGPQEGVPEMAISVEKLRKYKLLVVTPMYGGMCTGQYTQSLVNLAILCERHKIPMQFYCMFNESLIQRARNYCADEFMRNEEFTHMIFIDSDIEFDPVNVLALLNLADPGGDKDIICGPYPKKNISWEKVMVAVNKGFADQNPFQLEDFVGDFVFNCLPMKPGTEVNLFQPLEVFESGTGFMMIQRGTFEKFKKKFPERKYKPDHARNKDFDGVRYIHNYFPVEVDPKTERLLSEDYMFCQMVRQAGGKVWVCPWMTLNHIGSYSFKGNVSALAAAGVSLTADPSKLKGLKK